MEAGRARDSPGDRNSNNNNSNSNSSVSGKKERQRHASDGRRAKKEAAGGSSKKKGKRRKERALGSVVVGIQKSTNPKTKDYLVWAARKSTGMPVLVNVVKAVSKEEWRACRWKVLRKHATDTYPSPSHPHWRELDRRRLLMVGLHQAVYEIVLTEPTVNEETGAYYPIRLQCEVADVVLTSESFFVLSSESLANVTKRSLQVLDKWFMDPDMGLSSTIHSKLVKSRSLAAAFLRKHSAAAVMEEKKQGRTVFVPSGSKPGMVARFESTEDSTLGLVEQIYPVPVPMDDPHLVVTISQVFHFTHESIHWVGEIPNSGSLFTQILIPSNLDVGREKLHVYGNIVPAKGMYQHSNPRLKRPFEVLCAVLKIILACNGLPKSWLEEDGRVPANLDFSQRRFASYDEIFEKEQVFNVNEALNVLSKSISISRAGSLCIDYSVVLPVLVNTLSDLHAHFADLTKSRLKEAMAQHLSDLFGVQSVVTEIAEELREMEEERVKNQAGLSGGAGSGPGADPSSQDIVLKQFAKCLRGAYSELKLHMTLESDADCFVAPSFDLFESSSELRSYVASDTTLDFDELLQSELSIFRLCVKGAPGCGKSAICKRIAKLWASDAHALWKGKFDLVLYVPLDVATTPTYADLDDVTLEHIVEREYVKNDVQLAALLADRSEIRAWLTENSSRILWLLDGVDSLQDYVDNPYNARKPENGKARHNVLNFLEDLKLHRDEAVRHRLVTSTLHCKARVEADLYLMIRLLTNDDVSRYLHKYFGAQQEGQVEVKAGDGGGGGGAVNGGEQVSAGVRADNVVKHMTKTRVLSKDSLHVPINLELAARLYLADPSFHLEFHHPLSFLYEQFYAALRQQSVQLVDAEEEKAELLRQVQRVAWNSYFRSKFQSPTISHKLMKQVPRALRTLVPKTPFIERISGKQGLRFLHSRMHEYLIAHYVADTESDHFTPEVLSRLKSKIINRKYHVVFYFLVGLLRTDAKRLRKLFDLILLEKKELRLLGGKGVTFVFKCFEESDYDRHLRKPVLNWFWANFGQPSMQIWRNTLVIDLLELVLFKLSKKGDSVKLGNGKEVAFKEQAVRAFGKLGVDSHRVVSILLKAAKVYRLKLLHPIIETFRELNLSDIAIVPALLAGVEADNVECKMLSVGELRRVIAFHLGPGGLAGLEGGESGEGDDSGVGAVSSVPREVLKQVIGKLIVQANDYLQADTTDDASLRLVCGVLACLSQWKASEDQALPLLMRSLESEDRALRKEAIKALRWMNLSGPNVYYSEKVIGLLEKIAQSDRRLRADILSTFLQLRLEDDFVRNLLIKCVVQEDDKSLQQRCMLLCGEHYVKHPSVVEALAKVGQNSSDQNARRQAIDMLAYIHLPKYATMAGGGLDKEQGWSDIQVDINNAIDVLYSLGLSSKFVSHRVQRMADKKRKSSHMPYQLFVDKYC